MKLLIVLAVIAFGIWLWRSRHPPPPPAAPPGQPRAGQPAEMVRCAACGLHLPLADAERSARGVYCSKEHRRQIEG
ncbi:PP0621 family protein [Pseudorhodoferax sp.]|uniref:PP0621 family protein n=1 Tax=Pseudorhodoferax sp. TaxID=1993553 RepID=UPI0039E638C4